MHFELALPTENTAKEVRNLQVLGASTFGRNTGRLEIAAIQTKPTYAGFRESAFGAAVPAG